MALRVKSRSLAKGVQGPCRDLDEARVVPELQATDEAAAAMDAFVQGVQDIFVGGGTVMQGQIDSTRPALQMAQEAGRQAKNQLRASTSTLKMFE